MIPMLLKPTQKLTPKISLDLTYEGSSRSWFSSRPISLIIIRSLVVAKAHFRPEKSLCSPSVDHKKSGLLCICVSFASLLKSPLR